jgi:hypothetical protein
VAQAVECLPSKCEALSSTPSIAERKEERKGGKEEGREDERKRTLMMVSKIIPLLFMYQY